MTPMERLLKTSEAEEALPASAGTGGLQVTFYALLAVALAAGAWVRFNDQIAAIAPALAAPAASVAAQTSGAGQMKALVELGLLPNTAAQEAVAAMGLPTGDAALLTEALARRRVRLMHVPIVDASDSTADRVIEVSSAGYTTLVHVTRQPVTVTLPVGPVGTISFRTASPDGVGIGLLTLAGPVRLPDLPAGQRMEVGVIAQ
jgi:hypothetical protein